MRGKLYLILRATQQCCCNTVDQPSLAWLRMLRVSAGAWVAGCMTIACTHYSFGLAVCRCIGTFWCGVQCAFYLLINKLRRLQLSLKAKRRQEMTVHVQMSGQHQVKPGHQAYCVFPRWLMTSDHDPAIYPSLCKRGLHRFCGRGHT